MKASVARCLRTPPHSANRREFSVKCRTAIKQLDELPHSCHLQLEYSPITAVQCRTKTQSLHPRRSYFAPIKSHSEHKVPLAEWFLVEAPGTAPGSEWFISQAIYRHIWRASTLYIGDLSLNSKFNRKKPCV